MSKELPATLSSVRMEFATFFERVMVLYNLKFAKEETDHKVKDIRKYADELWEAGHISEYTKTEIDDSINHFSCLLPGKMKKDDPYLEYLDAWVSLAIMDINSEIGDCIH